MEENINSLYLSLIPEKQSLKLPNVFDVWIYSSTKNRGNRREDNIALSLCCFYQVQQPSLYEWKVLFLLPLNFQVFLKIDKSGNGLEIDQARLGNCKQLGNVFTEEKFRYMCILSGCDYLSSIHGIGLAKACKLLKLANNPDIIKVNLVLLCVLAFWEPISV